MALTEAPKPKDPQEHLGQQIQVVSVPKDALARHSGEPWASVIASAEEGADGLSITHIWHGYTFRQDARPTWTPMVDQRGNEAPYLKLDHAWLREIDKRAFLYLQNW